MTKTDPPKAAELASLTKFLNNNPEVNWQTIPLNDSKVVDSLNWKGNKYKRDMLLPLLSACQRIARILPEQDYDTILALLADGIHSARQIAKMPKSQFLVTYKSHFSGNESIAENVYDRAVVIYTKIMLNVLRRQQGQEPHIRQTNLQGRI